MSLRPKNIDQVVRSGLCSGCGACAYVRPETIRMVDFPSHGLRPKGINSSNLALEDGDALSVCPGAELKHTYNRSDPGIIGELAQGWGPIRQLWEGYSTDPQFRFSGSSGGAASALALFGLESEKFAGVLHTAASAATPYMNKSVFSRTRTELLASTGSRYAPASPCDSLQSIEDAQGPCLFIAKPCDIAASAKAVEIRPKLRRNLAITIAFFCAGTPSTNGTLEMLRKMGVHDPSTLHRLRYRGNGWPGNATAEFNVDGCELAISELTYAESWGNTLSKHVQWRCRLCIDHTGEFADIAVGDPWYRETIGGELGSSLILARTAKGEEFIRGAIAAGYLCADKVEPHILPDSQPNLLRTRGAVWGRILGCRLIGGHAPRFIQLPAFRFWLSELSLFQKAASVLGTVRRLLQRGLHPLQYSRKANVRFD